MATGEMYSGHKSELTGSADLIKFLKTFPKNIEVNMLNQSVKTAMTQGFATPMKKKIRSITKKRRGNLLKGVNVWKISGAPAGNWRIFMGPPAYHAHFFELGTVAQRSAFGKKSKRTHRPVKFQSGVFRMVTHTGGMKATPFFKPTITKNKMKAGTVLKDQLTKKIAAYIVPKRKAKRKN